MHAIRHDGTLLAPGAGEILAETPTGLLDLAAKPLGALPPPVGAVIRGQSTAGGQKSRESSDSEADGDQAAPHLKGL
jgi:hypothetical protein